MRYMLRDGSMPKVLVVGSLNMDLVVETPTFPRPGETLFGTAFATHAGGKGANQAVAAARLGAQVTLIGRVGCDAFGREMKAGLEAEGVGTRWVSDTRGVSTGTAAITVFNAENAIIVIPGANGALRPADLSAAEVEFAQADVILAQLEVPADTVEHAGTLAAQYGKPFVLNPAPATKLSQRLLSLCTLLVPNEHELATALGASQADWKDLLASLPGRIVVTKGADGAYFSDADRTLRHQSGFKVTPVDTTGAGDTFAGALVAFWNLGFEEAVRRGCAAGALSVTKAGARGGMPTLAELNTYLGTVP
jgi:ribokinase